jgi:hypothetical protein
MESNQKARSNPKDLHNGGRLQARTREHLTGNLQRFGFEKASKADSLQDIIEEMGEADAEDSATRVLDIESSSFSWLVWVAHRRVIL